MTVPAQVLSADDLLSSAPCCFERLAAAARENTYFVQRADADALRTAAYAMTGVPRRRCDAPLVGCYFRRAEGSPGGQWEGGPRVVVNADRLIARMGEILRRDAGPAAAARVVTVNSTHTFAQQVAAFAQCDLLASVHGSQNANVMWMRPGAAFMELNPHKFFYSSYQEVHRRAIRRNSAQFCAISLTRLLLHSSRR